MSGREFVREIAVDLPESEPRRDVLSTLWARARIDDLMNQDFAGIQQGSPRPEVSEAITQLGLEFRLMTQFTSFVAVEEMTITDGGEPRRIEVPVDMPEGVSHEGVFGAEADYSLGVGISASGNKSRSNNFRIDGSNTRARREKSGRGGGIGAGAGTGVGPGRGYGAGGSAPKVSAAPPVEVPGSVTGEIIQGTRKDDQVIKLRDKDEELKHQLGSKLHPSLLAVVVRLQDKGRQPSPDEARFVREGKALVQVWLADKSKGTLAALKQLGFELLLEPGSSSVVIGRVPLEKLEALAALQSVKYAAPMDAINQR